MLQEAARRPLDMAVRLGGEEFAVLLYDIDEAQARQRGEALRASLERLNIRHERSATASMPTGRSNQAKAFGRNQVVA